MTIKKEQDGTISYEGFCTDLLKQLAKMLHFTYEIYPSPDGQYGSITENGTWDGMIGELVNKVSTLRDISLVQLVKVTYWVLSVPLSLVVVVFINIFIRKRMKDLVSKETAMACRRGSEKLRFDIKRVVDEGQITTVKTLPSNKNIKKRTSKSEWPRPAVLETSAL